MATMIPDIDPGAVAITGSGFFIRPAATCRRGLPVFIPTSTGPAIMYMGGVTMSVSKVRKQVYLEAEQEAALKRRAAEEGCPEAELLRRALDSFLSRRSPGRRNPLWDMVGVVKDEITGGSVNHDDDIY